MRRNLKHIRHHLGTGLRWLLLVMVFYVAVVVSLGVGYRFMPALSTLMMADWVMLDPPLHRWVPLYAVSPAMVKAVVAAEDGRFCEHHGVDWLALEQVVKEADEDGPSRGASTLSMQVAKNLFLWPHRSYVRKSLELPIAIYLDAIWPKSRMVEVYLNIAEWGDGVYGVHAAARKYFGVSAWELNSHQASLLAAALPSPLRRNPAKPSRYTQNYAAQIRARMGGVDVGCVLRSRLIISNYL